MGRLSARPQLKPNFNFMSLFSKGCYALLFVLCLSVSNAQSIQKDSCQLSLCGKVIDRHDKQALPFATLVINGTDKAVVSDEKGNFCFENLCAGDYEVKSTHVGCEPVQMKVSVRKNLRMTIYHEHHLEELKELVVKTERGRDKESLQIVEMSSAQLFEMSGRPIGEIVNQLPGVNSLKTGQNISKPIIHGLHSNRIVIMNNELKQESQQWGSEHAPEIDSYVAEEVAVVKGASAVRYGPDAMAGVLIVNTRKLPDTSGVNGIINAGLASNGRMGVSSAQIEGAHERKNIFAWRLQGTAKRAGNMHTPDYFLKNTGVEEFNFSAQTGFTTRNMMAELFYSQFNSRIGIFSAAHIGNLTDLQRAIESPRPLEEDAFTYTIARPYQLVLHELFKAKLVYQTSRGFFSIIYGRQFNQRSEFDKHRPRVDSLARLNQPEFNLKITSHSAEVLHEVNFNEHHRNQTGISLLHQGNTYNGRFFIPNFRNRGVGVFSIERYRKGNWLLETGLRYDYRLLEVFMWEGGTIISPVHHFSSFSGNAGASWFVNTTQFNLNIGTAWRPPAINELYSDGVHHGAASFEIGNRNLQPEQAFNIQAGAQTTFLKGLSGEMMIYRNYIRNFIYLTPVFPASLTIRGAFPTFRFTQQDAVLTGGDALLRYQINKSVQMEAKAGILHAVAASTNEKIIWMPANRYSAGMRYHLPSTSGFRNSWMGFRINHVSRMNNVPPEMDYALPPPSYTLLDFESGTSIQLKKQTVMVSFSVNNLLNSRYREYLNRFRYYADEAGRNFILNLRIPIKIINP
jgi:iron complex outermembrane recepter protein